MLEKKLKEVIRDVVDFPKSGIVFKDITPVFQDPFLCASIVAYFYESWKNERIDAVAGIESRGFLLGSSIAMSLKVPFIPIRKKGKLPYHTYEQSYELEYGSATIEMHEDAISKGQRVLIHDDLLATGGTAYAASQLISKAGGVVSGYAFLIELAFLPGKEKLANRGIDSLVTYS